MALLRAFFIYSLLHSTRYAPRRIQKNHHKITHNIYHQ